MRVRKLLNSPVSEGKMEKENQFMNKTSLFFGLTTLLLLIAVAVLVVKPKISLPSVKLPSVSLPLKKGSEVSGYQAVFLTNGQVYFGKLSGFEGTAPVLRDVYYLRVGTVLEPGEASKQNDVKVEGKSKSAKKEETKETTSAALRQSLTLTKLGEEIHGPADEIKLNKDQILFVENLRDDSKVVQAIKSYQSSQKPPNK